MKIDKSKLLDLELITEYGGAAIREDVEVAADKIYKDLCDPETGKIRVYLGWYTASTFHRVNGVVYTTWSIGGR